MPSTPIVLEAMNFPEPVISSPSSPRPRPTRRSWATRSRSLADEDPTFRVRTDEETGQTIISGMGELHLEILVDRMQREFKVEANVGNPQVAYKETITKAVTSEQSSSSRSGGRGQYGARGARRSSRRVRLGFRLRERDRRRRASRGNTCPRSRRASRGA